MGSPYIGGGGWDQPLHQGKMGGNPRGRRPTSLGQPPPQTLGFGGAWASPSWLVHVAPIPLAHFSPLGILAQIN